MPTFPVFQGIGSTSACDSGIPRAPTLLARLTPACSWPWGWLTSHLPDAKRFPAHRSEPALLAHREVRQILGLLSDERAAEGVGRHLIDRRDHGVHIARVV